MQERRGVKIVLMAAVVLAALALPIALMVVGGDKMWREHTASAPSAELSDALRASAERAADAVLPTPTLGGEALTIECPPEHFEKETARIIRLARGVGGAASLWKDTGMTRVLANIPASAEEMFREAVRSGTEDIAMAGAPHPATVVDVLVRAPSDKSETQETAR